MDFSEFLKKVENNEIGLVFQMVVGRGGSLFMHSLLDSHPQILSYPGISNFYEDIWPAIENDSSETKKLISKILQHWIDLMLPYNIHHQLGEKKDETIKINPSEIAQTTVGLLEGKTKTRKFVFLAMQFAIAKQLNTNLNEINVIYCQEHTMYPKKSNIENIISDFKNSMFLTMIRDPRANFIAIKNWDKKRFEFGVKTWESQKYIQGAFADLCIYWYVKLLVIANSFPNNFILIRLEDLQQRQHELIDSLCKRINIKYLKSLEATTFQNKTWHGDSFSPQKTGFRKPVSPKSWKVDLSFFKKLEIEFFLHQELHALKYPILYYENYIYRFIAALLFPFFLIEDWKRIYERKYYAFMRQNKIGFFRAFGGSIKGYLIEKRKQLWFKFEANRKYPNVERIIFT